MKVNEDAEVTVVQMRARIAQLESALAAFVHPAIGYSSGVSSFGARWCAPKVTVAEMDAAREALGR